MYSYRYLISLFTIPLGTYEEARPINAAEGVTTFIITKFTSIFTVANLLQFFRISSHHLDHAVAHLTTFSTSHVQLSTPFRTEKPINNKF